MRDVHKLQIAHWSKTKCTLTPSPGQMVCQMACRLGMMGDVIRCRVLKANALLPQGTISFLQAGGVIHPSANKHPPNVYDEFHRPQTVVARSHHLPQPLCLLPSFRQPISRRLGEEQQRSRHLAFRNHLQKNHSCEFKPPPS